MINYVNNAYDKVLKPCDAQQFSIITNSQETERLILAHRAGDEKAKNRLPAVTYMGALDMEKYSKYCHQCKEQGTKMQGSRKAEFMRPTGLLMLDFDHVGEPKALYEQLAAKMDTSRLALAHITPSGDGLRLVLKRTKGMSIEQEQYEFCKAMEVKCDDVCKDISRLSFAPMQKEILYYNPSLLFGELPPQEDYPNNDLWGRTPSNSPSMGRTQTSLPTNEVNTPEVLPIEGADAKASVALTESLDSQKRLACEPTEGLRGSWDESYNGVPYSEIVERLEEQLGGRPERGARNSFIFTMACNLRYICDDNAEWVASILPTYGEEPQKHRMTIQSAINRPMSKTMPDTLKRALGVAKLCVDNGQLTNDNGQWLAPAMPKTLPEPIALLTSRTPDKMKAAVAMAVFPPLGTHLRGVRFTYWDGRSYEPTFMNVVVAELSSGKSAVNMPIDYILADIEARDDAALAREREWKDKCSRISNTQDKPERPKGLVVQVLPSDMTNAAFVQRLADADGYFLYTQMDEVELLNALKTNTSGNNVSAILRLAFDCGKYGQARVAANAINAKVRVRWNWNASSTIQRVRKFFAKNIADGTLSRISFATIIKDKEDAYGRNRPKYLAYGDHFADELRPYIDRLTTCSGTLVCPEAEAWAERLCDELSNFAEEVEDETYATMSFRAVLMGFFRAMVLYVMNGCQWTREIAEFAAWSVKYDLWCKMRFFRDMLHNDLQGEETAKQRGPVGLLSMLPREFTREEVKALRIAQGMKPDPKGVLAMWQTRRLVVKDDERGLYCKTSFT